MSVKIKLDHAGMREMLSSGPVAEAVHEIAAEKAEKVRAHPKIQEHGVTESVVVEDYVTDRAASAVAVLHPAALPIQAKYGVLTKAVES